MSTDRPDPVARLSAESLAAGDPTGWFERLYAEHEAEVPWDRDTPNPLLVEWFASRPDAIGRAVVVGCGPGWDAEFVASQGWAVTGFDVAPSAVAAAGSRHPDSPVTYVVADLLDLPPQWIGAFDLVVESHNVQALPVDLHARAAAAVASLVAPDGTLVAFGFVGADGPGAVDGPPWPLTRGEVEAFAGDGIDVVSIDQRPGVDGISERWVAQFHRAATATSARLTALITGKVQGVGFRDWTRRQAAPAGLVGSATNLSDGRVEVLAEGTREACERLVELLRGGTPFTITDVSVQWAGPIGGYERFTIG